MVAVGADMIGAKTIDGDQDDTRPFFATTGAAQNRAAPEWDEGVRHRACGVRRANPGLERDA